MELVTEAEIGARRKSIESGVRNRTLECRETRDVTLGTQLGLVSPGSIQYSHLSHLSSLQILDTVSMSASCQQFLRHNALTIMVCVRAKTRF